MAYFLIAVGFFHSLSISLQSLLFLHLLSCHWIHFYMTENNCNSFIPMIGVIVYICAACRTYEYDECVYDGRVTMR